MTLWFSTARRLTAVALLASGAAWGASASATAAPAQPPAALLAAAPTPATAWTARVVEPVTARTAPGEDAGRSIEDVDVDAPFWGGPNVLLVLGTATAGDEPYLKVLLKRRPVGSSGWIPASAVRLSVTHKRIVISISKRTLALQTDGRTTLTTRAVVGAGITPTPTGLFAVDAPVRQPRGSDLGPQVLAVAAYSDVLRDFDGGIPQMGIHGFERLGDPLGTARSHGCVRIPSHDVKRLIAKVPRGAPVLVQR